MDYAVVASLGALVALGELLSRYRDSPRRALLGSVAAWLYVAINAGASLAALGFLFVFEITFGQQGAALQWTRLLVGGIGAMAFFRTSVFTVRVGEQDLGVGPVSFLQIILNTVDRAVDSRRASARAEEVATLVSGLSYAKASISLPVYCLALMQNLSAEDQARLGQSVVALGEQQIPETVKLKILATYLLNAVGPDALHAAVKSLGEDLK